MYKIKEKNARAPARPFGGPVVESFQSNVTHHLFGALPTKNNPSSLSKVRRLSFVAIKTDPRISSFFFLPFLSSFTRPFRFLFYSSSSCLSVLLRLAMIKPYNVVTIFLFGPRRHSPSLSLPPLRVLVSLGSFGTPPTKTDGRTDGHTHGHTHVQGST